MNSFYPEVCRSEVSGMNVYIQLTTPKDKGPELGAYDIEVPYIEAVKKGMADLTYCGGDKKHILIAIKNEYIAEKAARYIENHEELFGTSQEKLSKSEKKYDYANSSFYQEVFGEDEKKGESPLFSFRMDTLSDKSHTLRNMYLQMLDGGPTPCEAVVFAGLQNGKDCEEKVRAILARQKGNIYIWIHPSQVNARWTRELIMEHQFGLVEIPEVPIEYYETILRLKIKDTGYVLSEEIDERELLQAMIAYRGEGFREESIEWLVDHAIHMNEKRTTTQNVLQWSDFELGEKGKAWKTLMDMPGLYKAKDKFQEWMAISKERFANPKLENFHKNMIVCGNPGTGKTEFGKLLGQYLSETGLCSGSFISVNRADLIGEYVGMTSKLVEKQFERAKDGVLFVDEAGFFLNRNSGGYVDEAIKEFVRFMEMYPETLVVFSMYEREATSFLELDEGIASRISDVIRFDDYNDEELLEIANYMFSNRGYSCDMEASKVMIRQYIGKKRKGKNFGNAREMRKLVESCITKHAVSVWGTRKHFDSVISREEVEAAILGLTDFVTEKCATIGF